MRAAKSRMDSIPCGFFGIDAHSGQMKRRHFLKLAHSPSLLLVPICIALMVGAVSTAAEDAVYYVGTKVVHGKKVPVAIRRGVKTAGPTRFFGTFKQGRNTFAAHFYDTSSVRVGERRSLSRSSCLDLIRFGAKKSWHRILRYEFTRSLSDKTDKMRIDFQTLWLNLVRKTTPLIYLQVADNYGDGIFGGRVDVYGVLLENLQSKAFIRFDGYNPVSPSTVSSSDIRSPDSRGNLTLVYGEADPVRYDETAYGWTGNGWQKVAHVVYGNDDPRHWNGTQFVPVLNEPQKP